MRVLVIGGAGFIGSHTVDALLAHGHEVRILDNLAKPVHLKGIPSYIPKEVEFIKGDIRSRKKSKACYTLSLLQIVLRLCRISAINCIKVLT